MCVSSGLLIYYIPRSYRYLEAMAFGFLACGYRHSLTHTRWSGLDKRWLRYITTQTVRAAESNYKKLDGKVFNRQSYNESHVVDPR